MALRRPPLRSALPLVLGGALALLVTPLLAGALETAPPRAWRHGAYVVPLEDLDLGASDLQKSALNNSTSAYPNATKDGHPWPLQSGGVLPVGGASPTYPVGFYNQSWSAKGGSATGKPVLAKTQSKVSPAKLVWAISPSIHATKLHAVIMGVNVYKSQIGKKIGVIRVHRDGADDLVRTLQVGTDVRHFKWSSKNPDFIGNAPSGASNLWTGDCSSGSEKCFVDAITVSIPADEVKHAITGVTVEAHRVARQVSGSSLLLYASLRVHSLTFETSYEASNGGATVSPLSQGDCSTGGSGWAAERYGGRRVGGTLYGPKRNIKAIGCGLTSATMVVNYHNGSALTPAQLNTELQDHSGYAASTVGTLDGFTASVQAACATLATTRDLGECGCCQGEACATACEDGTPPDHGDDADEVRTCCAVAANTALPTGGAATTGATVELYPTGYRRVSRSGAVTWRTSSMNKDLGTFSACGQAALPARPAVVSGNTPVASLEMSATAHPFDQDGCAPVDHPAFAGIEVHPTTHLPCKRHLKLATIVALNGTPSLSAGDSVKFFQLVSWGVIASRHGLSYTPRMELAEDDDEAEASAVEKLYAEGKVPILRVKNNSHFLVGTGTVPVWWPDAESQDGMEVASGGGFVGSWRVADPGKVSSPNLIQSMHPKNKPHRNVFSGYRLIAPGSSASGLSVTIHSPAELLVVGGDGKQVGWHPQEGRVASLPGASYGVAAVDVAPDEAAHADLDGLPKVVHLPASATPLTVHVIGTGYGPFALEARFVGAKGAVSGVWAHGNTAPGQVASWTLGASGGQPSFAALPSTDADKDGFLAPADCDDSDPARHPGAQESCTGGVDDDCDGATDAADPSCAAAAAPCKDADKDGFAACDGSCVAKGLTCGDCDDSDPMTHPGAAEGAATGLTCSDGRDNDCDGVVDAAVPSCAASLPSPFGSSALAEAIAAAPWKGGDADAEGGGDVATDAGSAGADGGGEGDGAGDGAGDPGVGDGAADPGPIAAADVPGGGGAAGAGGASPAPRGGGCATGGERAPADALALLLALAVVAVIRGRISVS